jgi:hypothetical protein
VLLVVELLVANMPVVKRELSAARIKILSAE